MHGPGLQPAGMADRTCKTCNKQFQSPSHLRRHEGRKTPCAQIITPDIHQVVDAQKPHACKFCGRRYTQSSGLSRHTKGRCKIAGTREGMQALYEHTLVRHLADSAALKSAEDRITALETQLEHLHHAPALPPSYTLIGTQNNNITINTFGRENCEHISRSTIKTMLDDVMCKLKNPAEGAAVALVEAAMMIYSDRTHPENTTCYLPNAKQDKAMVHEATGWGIRPYGIVAPSMAQRVCDLLFDLQPFTDADKYGELMRALRDNEDAYKSGKELRDVLIRNKSIITAAHAEMSAKSAIHTGCEN